MSKSAESETVRLISSRIIAAYCFRSPMDLRLKRSDTHLQLSSNFFVRRKSLRVEGVQKRSQRLERAFPVLSNIFPAEPIHRLSEQGHRPPRIEDLFGCQLFDRFKPVAILGFFEVDIDELHLPASFKTARPIRFVRKEVLQRRQQKRAKLALRSIDPTQRFIFNKVKKKTLYQVLRIFGRIASVPNIGIQRVPIEFA